MRPMPSPAPPSLSTIAERVYATAYEALDNDDLRTAERFFGLLLLLAPRDERAWIGLAVVRERKEDWAMAAARYLLGGALVPDSAWCHIGRGRALLQLGRGHEADEAFAEAESVTSDAALLRVIERERDPS
ncbi:MAG: hypothetical protein AMXMBFR56_53010 [Polyangiaceae bacterium]